MVAVVKADCQCLAAMGIVVIMAAVATVYSSHTTVVGGMMPTAIAAAARGVGEGAFSNAIAGEGERGGSVPPPLPLWGG